MKKSTTKKRVRAWALLYRGELFAIQKNQPSKFYNEIMCNMEGKMRRYKTLRKVECEITFTLPTKKR